MKKRKKLRLGRKSEFIIGLSLSIFLVFSIFIVNTVITYNSEEDYTYEKVDIISNTVYENFSNTLINIDNVSKSVFLNVEFQDLVSNLDDDYNNKINRINLIFEKAALSSDSSLIKDIGYIPRINESLNVSEFIHYGYHTNLFTIYNGENENFTEIIKESQSAPYLNGAIYGIQTKYLGENAEIIIFARNIYDIRPATYNKLMGIGYICVNRIKLESILNYSLAIDGLYMYAQNTDDLLFKSDGVGNIADFNDNKYLKNQRSLSFYGWTLYQVYDTNYILKSLSTYIITEIIISVSIIVIFIILYFLLHMRNLKSLYYMFDKFSSNTNRKLSMIDYIDDEEVNRVIKAYNDMVAFNNKLNEDIILEKDKALQSQIQKNEFEIKSLYSQINKHYFINVLSVIHSLINLKAIDKANYCLENLSDFLRYSLNLGSEADLKSELNSVISYFNVQSVRYPKVKYIVSYDDELDEIIVPKLIIQPLVENAYVHGLKNKTGNITVICKKVDSFIIIEVIDDGDVITQEELEYINKKIQLCEEKVEINKNHHGIALVNIQRRLKLMYEENANLSIKITDDNKTISSIKIKMEK